MSNSLATSTNALPFGWGTPVGTVSGPVWPGNATSGGTIFINNSPVVVAICPAVVNLATTQGVYPGPTVGVAVVGGAGSVNINPGDKFIIDNLLCTGGFNGIAAGTGGSLTIWSF